MREVHRDKFYESISRGDIVTSVTGDYPYTIEFYPRNNRYNVVGKISGCPQEGSGLSQNKYFLK